MSQDDFAFMGLIKGEYRCSNRKPGTRVVDGCRISLALALPKIRSRCRCSILGYKLHSFNSWSFDKCMCCFLVCWFCCWLGIWKQIGSLFLECYKVLQGVTGDPKSSGITQWYFENTGSIEASIEGCNHPTASQYFTTVSPGVTYGRWQIMADLPLGSFLFRGVRGPPPRILQNPATWSRSDQFQDVSLGSSHFGRLRSTDVNLMNLNKILILILYYYYYIIIIINKYHPPWNPGDPTMPSFQLLDTVGPTLDFNVISGEIAARQQRLTVRPAAWLWGSKMDS